MVEKRGTSINIFGSCVSRDFFEIGNHQNDIQNYYSFINPISLFLTGTNNYPDLTELSPWLNKNYIHDLRKDVFSSMSSNKTDYLVLDIADIRYPISKYASETETFYVTDARMNRCYSEIICNSKCCTTEKINILDVDHSIIRNGLTNFSDRILDLYDSENIILIEPFLSDKYIEGETIKMFPGDVSNMNHFFKKCYNYLENKLKCHVIKIPPRTIANYNHKWGLDRLHYCDSTYVKILEDVNRIITGKICRRDYHNTAITYGGLPTKGHIDFKQNDLKILRRFYQTSLLTSPGYAKGTIDLGEFQKAIEKSEIISSDVCNSIFTELLEGNPVFLFIDAFDCRIPIISIEGEDGSIDITKSRHWDAIGYFDEPPNVSFLKKTKDLSISEIIERTVIFCNNIKKNYIGNIVLLKVEVEEVNLDRTMKNRYDDLNYVFKIVNDVMERELSPAFSTKVSIRKDGLGEAINISDIVETFFNKFPGSS